MSTEHPAPIGIIGGTGLETFPELTILESRLVKTPYGPPSEALWFAEYQGVPIVFLPRHGMVHQHAPHRIPYKANVFALKAVGVKTIISTCIVGSLKKKIAPGAFVLPDQFVHFTHGRDDGGDERVFIHLPMAEPFCQALRQEARTALLNEGATVYGQGTIVVIQGPRFSTKAESQFFIRNRWDVVNMTQYPECYFARELGLCYATIASVTDWDVGVGKTLSMDPSNMDQVLAIFRRNVQVTRTTVLRLIERLGSFRCGCAQHLIAEYYKQ
ncbi:MTAP family purine nucleoside phosphorylase [Candidatus Uhrbacteria bacterium]|nr:MTAP family purine nucleoside phosphorylase [Candidatus Uhrbacteria bacterium]